MLNAVSLCYVAGLCGYLRLDLLRRLQRPFLVSINLQLIFEESYLVIPRNQLKANHATTLYEYE